MKRKTLLIVTVTLYIALAILVFMWRGGDGERQRTEKAFKEAEAIFDERLPNIVPHRYEETKERTVKDREAVHEEAQTLSRDALADALNAELVLFAPVIVGY